MSNILKIAAAGAGGETDDDFASTVLLLHGDGTNGAQNNTFLDSSTNNFTITRNGNTTQGSFSPFSKPDSRWGNYFDGNGDYLTVPDNGDLDLGTGNFCVEFFWYPQSTSSQQYPLIGDSTGNWYVIWESGNLSLGRRAQGNDVSTSGFTLAQNTWQHICVTRQSTGTNDTRIFVNGVLYGVGTSSQNYAITTTLAIGATQSAGQPITGYLSNVRVIKGSVPVEYQTASTTNGATIFTPPTTALTAVSGTELLTCQSNRFVDNSTNNFAITAAGNVKVTPFSPFPITTEYSGNSGSGYFDGSGDYLDVGSDANLTIGTSDFTISMSVYFTVQSAGTSQVIFDGRPSTSTNAIIPYILYSNSEGGIVYVVSGTTRINSGFIPVANQWYSLTVSRLSGTTRMFMNGVQVGSDYTDGNTYAAFASDRPRIGSRGNSAGAALYFPGYISGLQILVGTGYASFSIPTSPPTVITNTELLLNFTNAGIFDNTGFSVLESIDGCQISTTTKKYGTGSVSFDGAGDYLIYNLLNINDFGSGDFTVECWFYLNATGSQRLISARDNDGGLTLGVNSSTQVTTFFAEGSGSITGATISTGAWNHVALVRYSGTATLYLNGVSQGTSNWASKTFGSTQYRIGNSLDTRNEDVNGFIDDLRISRVARYTTTFTPPTKAFPNIGS